MSASEQYQVQARTRVFPDELLAAETVIFHQMINSGGSTLAKVFGEMATARGELWENSQLLREDPAVFRRMRDGLGFIYGHNAYGLHEICRLPAAYFTLLREPVIAYVSRYHNWQFMDPRFVKEMSLPEFVAAGRGANHQTRDLARCTENNRKLDAKLDRDDIYALALETLDERMVFCGITDLFEETIFLLSHAFGWDQATMWQRRLATPGRPSLESLAPDLVERIRELVDVDIRVYERQRRILLALFARADFDAEFDRYKTDAAQGGAFEFEEARIQKFELLVNKLRRDIESKDRVIAEQKAALQRAVELLELTRRAAHATDAG